jgi:hypothetical protein
MGKYGLGLGFPAACILHVLPHLLQEPRRLLLHHWVAVLAQLLDTLA